MIMSKPRRVFEASFKQKAVELSYPRHGGSSKEVFEVLYYCTAGPHRYIQGSSPGCSFFSEIRDFFPLSQFVGMR